VDGLFLFPEVVMGLATNLTHGPAQVLFATVDVGHTQGGVVMNVSPQNRMRQVDQYGEGELAAIHTGDQVRVTVPIAEWTAAAMQNVYAAGLQTGLSGSTSGYLGVGRSAGYVYPTKELQVIPLVASEAAKKAVFWRTCPIGEFELSHNTDDDKIFEVEHACLVDETKTDGELIGKIFRS
jgi:hypothetical protein